MAIVRGVESDELRETYELRLLLEPPEIRKAVPRLSDGELDRAERTAMSDHRDLGDRAEADRARHAFFEAGSVAHPHPHHGRVARSTGCRWPTRTFRSGPTRSLADSSTPVGRGTRHAAKLGEERLTSTFEAMLENRPEPDASF